MGDIALASYVPAREAKFFARLSYLLTGGYLEFEWIHQYSSIPRSFTSLGSGLGPFGVTLKVDATISA